MAFHRDPKTFVSSTISLFLEHPSKPLTPVGLPIALQCRPVQMPPLDHEKHLGGRGWASPISKVVQQQALEPVSLAPMDMLSNRSLPQFLFSVNPE